MSRAFVGTRGLAWGILCLGWACASTAAADDGAGAESPLSRATDARVLAMGGVGTVLGDGPESAAQNPALLAWLGRGVLSLYHTDLYTPDTALQSGFAAYPTLDLGVFAVGVQRLAIGGIDARDDRNVALDDVEASETHVSLGYAHAVRSWLAIGADLRIVQQDVAGTGATAAGLDLGLSVRRELPRSGHFLDVGLALQNAVAPSLRLDEVDVRDPLRSRLGVAYRWDPSQGRLHGVLGVEAAHAKDSDLRWGVGTEIGLDRTFFLRGGADTGALTAGLGVRVHGVEFAYAFRSDEDLPRDDRFTVSFRFGNSTSQRRQNRILREEQQVTRRLESMLASREDETLQRARTEAGRAWENAEFGRAEVLYGRVLLLDPDDSQARERVDAAARRLALRNARGELANGAAALAVTSFQQILDRWPGDVEASEGLATARDTVERDRDQRGQVRALFSAALGRFTDGDFDGADVALDELLRLDRNDAGALELRTRIDAARSARVESLFANARREAAAGRPAQAASVLESARGLVPTRDEEIARQIDAWRDDAERMRRDAAAARTTRERLVVSAAPATKALTEADRERLRSWFEEGLRDFEAGDYERATLSWRRVWDVDPDHADVAEHIVRAHLLLGMDAYTRGEYDRALLQCRRALDIQPENDKAQRYVARIEEERTRVRAIEDWRADR